MTYQLVELGSINPILTYFYQLARQICRIRGAKPGIASLQYPNNIQTIITDLKKYKPLVIMVQVQHTQTQMCYCLKKNSLESILMVQVLLQILLKSRRQLPFPPPNPTGSAGLTGRFFQSYSWTLVSSMIGSLSSIFSAIIRSAFVLSSITYLKRNNITLLVQRGSLA